MNTRHLAGLALAGTGLAVTAATLTTPVAAQTAAPAPAPAAGSGTIPPAPMPPGEAAPLPPAVDTTLTPVPEPGSGTTGGSGTTTTVVGEPFVVGHGRHAHGTTHGYGFPYGCPTAACQPGLLPHLGGLPLGGLGHGAGLTAPDAGFNVPNRSPIPYDAVRYWKWNPEVPYGLPGSVHPQTLPVVSVPTDTTQLGYYYQRVPAWRPMPGMIPPPPNPDMIHDRNCRGGACGYGPTAGGIAAPGATGYLPEAGPFKLPIDTGAESPDGGYGPMATGVPGPTTY